MVSVHGGGGIWWAAILAAQGGGTRNTGSTTRSSIAWPATSSRCGSSAWSGHARRISTARPGYPAYGARGLLAGRRREGPPACRSRLARRVCELQSITPLGKDVIAAYNPREPVRSREPSVGQNGGVRATTHANPTLGYCPRGSRRFCALARIFAQCNLHKTHRAPDDSNYARGILGLLTVSDKEGAGKSR
jgi:hypothetical protein